MAISKHSESSAIRQAKAAAWRRRMDKWARSGLSQGIFCQRHELALSTFVYWRKKLRDHAGPKTKRCQSPGTGFIPVHVKEGGAALMGRSVGWACEVEGAQGVKVRFSERPSLARLEKVVAVLAGASE